jgi:hypothetical protein
VVGTGVPDVVQGSRVAGCAIVVPQKTQRPVALELTEPTRDAVAIPDATAHPRPKQLLLPSAVTESPHLPTAQHSRIVGELGAVGRARPDGPRHPFHEARQADVAGRWPPRRVPCLVERTRVPPPPRARCALPAIPTRATD